MLKFEKMFNEVYINTIDGYIGWIQSNPIHYFLVAIDIILVIYLIKKGYEIIKDTNAIQMVKGILILLIVTVLSYWCKLYILNFILKSIMTYGVLLIMIVFQPEIRKAIGNLGTNRKLQHLIPFYKEDEITLPIVREVAQACEIMSNKRVGALIILSRKIKLGEYIQTGIEIQAKVTKELIINLFEPNTPLHDGAIIIEEERIRAAACILPLTKRNDISSDFGTRHRACIGITEVSDAIAIVVSEETGKISVAMDGKISTNLTKKELEDFIQEKLEISEVVNKK